MHDSDRTVHPVGRRRWGFAAGYLPDGSTGPEPWFTSRDELCVLNAGPSIAHLELTIYHEEVDPVGPYRLTVGAKRVCHARINDLIDPEAVPLGVPYGLVIESTVPVLVAFRHYDTRRAELAVAISPAAALE